MATHVDVDDAEQRIRPFIHRTPVLTSAFLDALSGKNLFFKCENLQKTGSFKARGALNAILKAKENGPLNGIIAHSGGNHGQGVAWAAQQSHLLATVCVPSIAPEAKMDAMRGYGSELVIVEPSMKVMSETCHRLAAEKGFTVIDPMNDYAIMSGQGTVAKEFLEQTPQLDVLLVAVGGGGLAAGVAACVKKMNPTCKVICVEPQGKNLETSLKAGKLLIEFGGLLDTVADGCRPHSIGDKCFAVLHECAEHTVFTVNDEEILAAMKLILERMKVVVEPSAAMGLAAVLKYKTELEKYHNVGLILCGGNVDLKRVVGLL